MTASGPRWRMSTSPMRTLPRVALRRAAGRHCWQHWAHGQRTGCPVHAQGVRRYDALTGPLGGGQWLLPVRCVVCGRGSIGGAMLKPTATHPQPIAPARRTRQLTRRRLVTTTLVTLGAALSLSGLVGCRLDVPTPPTPTAAPSAIVDPNELAIGAILSLTGRFSREGALMKAGYET